MPDQPDQAAPETTDTRPAACEHGAPLDQVCRECMTALDATTRARQSEPPASVDAPRHARRSSEPTRVDLTAGLRADSRLARALERVAREDPDAARERMAAEDRAELDALDSAIRAQRFTTYMANVLGDYADARYDKLTPQQNPKGGRVTRWWAGPTRTLVIAGPSSHGKSFAAYAVTNEVALADRDAPRGVPRVVVRAWNVATLRRRLSPPAAHERNDPTLSAARDRIYDELLDCDLLLLDDLGREYGHDWWGTIVYEVLEHRTQDAGRRRTIITMNAVDQRAVGNMIVERYGSPVWTRVRHDSSWAWIEGAEFRLHAPDSEDLFK